MDDTLWSLFNRLDGELLSISSLITGTRCMIENEPDANAEIDLLTLAEVKIEESRERLKEMQQEYRKLGKTTKQEPEKAEA